MKEGTVELFSTEIKQSYRDFRNRVKERPVMTIWFIMLLVSGFLMVLVMVEIVQGFDDLPFTLSQGNVLFVIFFVIMSKASVETVENTMKNDQLKHYFSAPISPRKVQLSRFLKVFWYNLLLVAISLTIVSFLIYAFRFDLPIDQYFLYQLYTVVIAAPVIGFNIGVLTQSKGLLKKVLLLLVYGQSITLVWLSLHSNLRAGQVIFYIILITLISIIVLLFSKDVFWRGWKNGTTPSSTKISHLQGKNDLLPDFLDPMTKKVAEKEILIRWRRKESPASLGVTALIGGGLIFFYLQLGPNPDLGLGLDEFFYPVLIGMSLFLTGTLQILFPSLSLFGREGKAFWAIKSLPVEPRNLIWGKILAILIFSPAIPLLVALPLLLLLNYSLEIILFLLLSSVLMILLLGGIGVWASVRYSNFDESVNGAPDVTTMYTMMMAALFLYGFFVTIPSALLNLDVTIGLIAMGIAILLAVIIFLSFSELAAKSFEDMQMDF